MPDSKEIGKRLEQLRGPLSQRKAAIALGITQTALWNYEQGIRVPRDEIKTRIARFYGKTVQEIFFD